MPSQVVAESTIREYVRERKRELGWSARVTCVPQDYALGQEGQVDWYEAWAELDGVQVPLQVMARRIPCTHRSQYRPNIDSGALFRPRRPVKLGVGIKPRRSPDRRTRPAALSDWAFTGAKGGWSPVLFSELPRTRSTWLWPSRAETYRLRRWRFSDNSVSGNLQCSGNSSITGGGNSAKGNKQGQCAGF
jgi:hypothetical protein